MPRPERLFLNTNTKPNSSPKVVLCV
jgi:hypothetical protein